MAQRGALIVVILTRFQAAGCYAVLGTVHLFALTGEVGLVLPNPRAYCTLQRRSIVHLKLLSDIGSVMLLSMEQFTLGH